MLTRRNFLKTSCAWSGRGALVSACGRDPSRTAGLVHAGRFSGGIVGASSAVGHRLRKGDFPPFSETLEVEAVVIGGGISGLSAARRLQRQGIADLLLLEMEPAPGGNSLSGQNDVSAYPWGAHYLPLPGEEAIEITELLEELGLMIGRDSRGAPIFDEYALCADPMERLFVNGRWQEGLIPRLDLTAIEREEIDAFLNEMEMLRNARGSDGRRPFVIPVDRSSQDPDFLAYDGISMAAYLDSKGWRGEALRWYVDYCCRDDYGAGLEHISAWAGLHYFASRNGRAANAASGAVLTWPEGNGWLARKLSEPLRTQTRSRALAWQIDVRSEGRVTVDYLDLVREKTVRVQARGAVCALPRFVAERAIQTSVGPLPPAKLDYSPWMVANLTLSALPGGWGEELAWDNVLRRSRSLGYVVATHQNVERRPRRTVITYYQPLDDAPPAEARQAAYGRSYASWCDQILGDLRQAHPELPLHVTHLDVWLWGHAMSRPTPGTLWGGGRTGLSQPIGSLAFAHSDLSGLSLFEEAYIRGQQAADVVLKQLRARPPA